MLDGVYTRDYSYVNGPAAFRATANGGIHARVFCDRLNLLTRELDAWKTAAAKMNACTNVHDRAKWLKWAQLGPARDDLMGARSGDGVPMDIGDVDMTDPGGGGDGEENCHLDEDEEGRDRDQLG